MKTMRLWFACVFGLALSMVFGWSYGFFCDIVADVYYRPR
ncbi:DUF2955 domain-containing protein [Moritella sp. F3]|nr:DUF2955 domain-containing protein [Moritella sp. F3]